jgi:hypothetical protein
MNRYVAKGINVSCRTIAGTAYIFDQQTRVLLQLDQVGSIIWDHINGTRTVDEIADICCTIFSGDNEEIRIAVHEFIDDLVKRNVAATSMTIFVEEMISAC